MTKFRFAFIAVFSLSAFSAPPARADGFWKTFTSFLGRHVVGTPSPTEFPLVMDAQIVPNIVKPVEEAPALRTEFELDADFLRLIRAYGTKNLKQLPEKKNITEQTRPLDLLCGDGYWWHPYNVYHNFFSAKDSQFEFDETSELYLDLSSKLERIFSAEKKGQQGIQLSDIQKRYIYLEGKARDILSIYDDEEFEEALRILGRKMDCFEVFFREDVEMR